MKIRLGAGLAAALVLLLSACSSSPPRNVDNLCAIFEQKRNWYRDADRARKRWDGSVAAMMAMMHQESRFVAKAKPPRKKIFGFIPGPRPSNAYGYSQALKSTWKAYQRSAGRYGADRNDFDDAIDFIGWYNKQSQDRCGIGGDDTYRLYLAYHEGHGGFNRGSFQSKPRLQQVARKVERRAQRYQTQLAGCEKQLRKRSGWFPWF